MEGNWRGNGGDINPMIHPSTSKDPSNDPSIHILPDSLHTWIVRTPEVRITTVRTIIVIVGLLCLLCLLYGE